MPKSVHVFSRKMGNLISCPYCDYSLANNKKGMILHLKASHNAKAGINPEKVPDEKVCFCGKRDCEKYKIHTCSR